MAAGGLPVTYLLDINVLLALQYDVHTHHHIAVAWLNGLKGRRAAVKLATCSITELGFVRVASGVARYVRNVRLAKDDLKRLKTLGRFIFLDDMLGADRLPVWVENHKQVTDGHLLSLAAANRAVLITLDRGIPGALLLGGEPKDPSMVREPTSHYGVTVWRARPCAPPPPT